jgi:excisionase family DNA binding protein
MSPTEFSAEGNGDRLLTAPEAAALLSVPESWVREQARLGLVPHIRLGRYVRFRRSAVLAWLESHEVGGGTRTRRRNR